MREHLAGIIGYGGMAQAHHLHLPHPGLRYAAAYDIDPKRNEIARRDGLKPCGSLKELLEDPRLELILVATPNQDHLPNVVAALEAGKNVLCEKPAALNSRELDQMYTTAHRMEKLLAIHQNRRWDRDYRIVSQILASGQLGRLFRVESRVQGSRGIADTWRRYSRFGGGMLYDWGVHLIDQILMLTSEKVTGVWAEFQYLRQFEVDENLRLTLLFESGFSALVEIGTCSYQMLPRWYLCGTEGTTLIPYWDCKGETIVSNGEELPWEEEIKTASLIGPSRTLQPRGENTVRHIPLPVVEPQPGAFYENLVAALEGREQLAVTEAEERRLLQVMDMAFLSAKEKRLISL